MEDKYCMTCGSKLDFVNKKNMVYKCPNCHYAILRLPDEDKKIIPGEGNG